MNRKLFFFLQILTIALFSLCSLSILSGVVQAANPLAADLVQDGQPIDFRQSKFTQLFTELQQQHKFTPEQLRSIFTGLTIDRKVLVLMDKQWEAKPYYQYAPRFITDTVIQTGREKLAQHRQLLDQIEQQFGVDREVVVAIWGVETRYGEHQGNYNVLRTLTTLFDAYPRRASFFRKQLVHFLLLCRETGTDPRTVKGSYAGAFGQTQFIPSSFREYAVSFDGDHKRDVWNSSADILASIANYLKRSGWTLHAPVFVELGNTLNRPQLVSAEEKGWKATVSSAAVEHAQRIHLPPVPGKKGLTIVGLELPPDATSPKRYVAGYPNLQAITEWNHSNRYAMAVAELAQLLKQPAHQ